MPVNPIDPIGKTKRKMPVKPYGNPGMPVGGATANQRPPARYGSADTMDRTPTKRPGMLDFITRFATDAFDGGRQAMDAYKYGQQYDPNARPGGALPSPGGVGGGGSGGGGYGGGGGGGGLSDADANALWTAVTGVNTLYKDYNAPADTSFEDLLSSQTAQATATGASAVDRLKATIGAQANPYQTQVKAAGVDANPMAQYMSASGASTGEVDAFRAMLQGSSNDSAAAAQSNNDRMAQSWAASQSSRTADADSAQAQFAQTLAANNSGAAAQIAAKRKEQKDAQKMAIIKLAIENGINLEALGVTF